MDLVKLTVSTEEEKKELNQLFEEAKPYFLKVEGREPLAPLIDIDTVIPNIPKELVYCLSIRYLNQLVGYIWIFEESKTNFYILHMYISDKFKKQGLGKLAIYELDNYYLKRDFLTAELLVSGSNYLGLKFWTAVGFDKIIYIEAPEENMIT
ncbi:GNAT family N-acetyltransferase, partial [Carnobacterium sp.]|uniref:GNAT family N-acetyltransferase n=1 Tax=Carnobacterium sp. TaxID=48221 RepID=UPI0028AB1D37